MINRIGRWAAAVATGVFAISASALAADMPVKAPPPVVVVQSWTGFYVGAHGGYAWGRNSVGYSANDPASAGLFASVGPLGTAGMNASNRFTTRGALGGLQVGYNRQIGPRGVVGVEPISACQASEAPRLAPAPLLVSRSALRRKKE
jgi:outer membrane immunogenic protein